MERLTFRTIVMQRIVQKRNRSESLLADSSLTSAFDANERAMIADALEFCTYNPGERIIAQGDKASALLAASTTPTTTTSSTTSTTPSHSFTLPRRSPPSTG